ncbi:hypothetical protein Tco_1284205 [Tanacetum coccineum]
MDNHVLPPTPLSFPSCKIAKLAIPQLPKLDSTARMASKETQGEKKLKARSLLLCTTSQHAQMQEDKETKKT